MLNQSFAEEDMENESLDEGQFKQYLSRLSNWKGGVSDKEEDIEGQTELQELIINNLTLEYEIFLAEEEVKFYKIILTDKENEIKRLNQIQAKKNGKMNAISDKIKRVNKSIKQVKQGYKLIVQKKEQGFKKQENHRNERLAYQERKNALYGKYCDLEEAHNSILEQINSYEEQEIAFQDIKKENDLLKKQIAELEKGKDYDDQKESNKIKEELKWQVKNLYQKIKIAEKDEARICKEYEIKKKKLKGLQHDFKLTAQKSLEINELYQKISGLKEECRERKSLKQDKQKQYHGILAEETRLKKELSLLQNRKQQRKIQQKSTQIHNFKIIDSQADEELHKNSKYFRSNSHHHNSSQSHQQFDQLIDRFQKIKSKSKNLT